MVSTVNTSVVIEEVVSRIVPDAFIVELILPDGINRILSLRVDTDKGISIDECTKLSRELSRILEAEDPFDFPWTLEVSSPGVGRPLQIKRQYIKNIGRKLKVVTKSKQTHIGILSAVNEDSITLSPPPPEGKPGKQVKKDAEGPVEILFSDIKEAKVQILIGN